MVQYKKIGCLLLAVLLVFGLAATGCGKKNKNDEKETQETTKENTKVENLTTIRANENDTYVSASAVISDDSAREVMDFNNEWLYSPKNYSNGYEKELDETGFEMVSIPHANTIIEKHKGNDFISQIESYRFVSLYRRHFALDSSYEGKRIFVEFQGVATIAEVYVNGEAVGTHKGAYTSFTYDITDFVKTDGSDNVISVKVDSTKQADIPPEGGSVDYCLFGGIVRDVFMIVTDPVYVDQSFVTSPDLTSEAGKIKTETVVKNSGKETEKVTIETVVLDAEGNEVAKATSEESIEAGKSMTVNQTTEEIKNPHLWGLEDPYLYVVRVNVKKGDTYVDTFETTFGMRYFEFTSTDDGSSFYLNGEENILIGVNRHEQWPWIGRAVNNKLQAADADLIKDAGFNAVRCSHYTQDPEFLQRCDEIGLLVFEEAPGWQYVGGKEWQAIYVQNIYDMIMRDRNHTSIISWGVRVNESFDSHTLYEETNEIAHTLDTTRPTHGVRRFEHYATSEFQEDLFTVNYTYPTSPKYTPFLITEHSMDWYNGDGIPGASDTKEAEFIKSFADSVNYYFGNNQCAGGFAWSMFDYNNEVNYTNTGHVFYSGMYDIYRLPKPVAYLYRSQKAPEVEKVLYIANNWTSTSPTTVMVLSNCDEVELFVNGDSVGKIKPNKYTSMPHPIYEFEGVTYSAGELTAVGYIDGVEVARTTKKTPETVAKLELKADYDTIIADGVDFTSISITALDANGTKVPYASNSVTIEVSGAGKFIGEETIALEGGQAAFLVQSEYLKTGKVTCTVKANGIEGATCTINVTEYDISNTVPVSEHKGNIAPEEVKVYSFNDTVAGSGMNQFNYVGTGWLYCSETNCYLADNYYSEAADDYVTFTFEGKNIKWYGSKAPAHGIMAVSIDGGEEKMIDCYASSRNDQQLLYDSGELTSGEHTLKVRVCRTKNDSASGYYINVDRVVIE